MKIITEVAHISNKLQLTDSGKLEGFVQFCEVRMLTQRGIAGKKHSLDITNTSSKFTRVDITGSTSNSSRSHAQCNFFIYGILYPQNNLNGIEAIHFFPKICEIINEIIPRENWACDLLEFKGASTYVNPCELKQRVCYIKRLLSLLFLSGSTF